MHKQQNIAKKAQFYEQLKKMKQYQNQRQNFVKSDYQQSSSQQHKMQQMFKKTSQKATTYQIKFLFWGVFGSLILAYSYYFFIKKSPKQEKTIQKPKQYTKEQLKTIQKKSVQNYQQKVQKIIESVTSQQPPMLKFPSKDPDIFTQLIQYSIAPDIHLYQVSSEQFYNNPRTLPKLEVSDKFALNKIKANTTLTLSLQAERCLQNIYVKVKDVIEQIQKNGKFVPPKVFFRFFGYIMFEIRDKPLSLRNYRGTEYISLFDLYFDYYSPIFLKRDLYTQYLVGHQNTKHFGYVHLNHRPIQEIYLKGEKAVFMKKYENGGDYNYNLIWQKFYINHKMLIQNPTKNRHLY